MSELPMAAELNNNYLYSPQLSFCYLKELIIKSITIDFISTMEKSPDKVQQYFDNNILNNILQFIDANIYEYININQICSEFSFFKIIF